MRAAFRGARGGDTPAQSLTVVAGVREFKRHKVVVLATLEILAQGRRERDAQRAGQPVVKGHLVGGTVHVAGSVVDKNWSDPR